MSRTRRTPRPEDPLRILHVAAPAAVGGMERVLQALASGHARRGHSVSVAVVLSPGAPGPPWLESLAGAGVDLVTLRVPGRRYLRERATIGDLCRRLAPEIVHTHGYRPDVLDAPVARGLGIATVTTVHGFTGGGWKNRTYQWLQRRTLRRFDAIVAVSRALREELLKYGVSSRRLHLVRNAWAPTVAPLERAEARRRLGIENGRLHIGWVGRLSREKGPDVLLDALPRLADLPLTVSFVGTGPQRAPLVERARALGLSDRVRWHGLVPDAERLFPAFDLFVLSSRTEGTPIVLFEAMAARVPIVATRVGGVPDVVGPAESLLVPPERLGAVADAIRAVHERPLRAARTAEAARARLAREFALEPWLDRHETLYRMLARRGEPVAHGIEAQAS